MSTSNINQVFIQENATLERLIQFKLTDGIDTDSVTVLPVYCEEKDVKLYNRTITKKAPLSRIVRKLLNIKKITVTEHIRIDNTGYYCTINAPIDRKHEFDFNETYSCIQEGNNLIGTFTANIINNVHIMARESIEKTYIEERFKKLKEELLAATVDYVAGPRIESPIDSPPDSPVKLSSNNDIFVNDGYDYDDMIIQ